MLCVLDVVRRGVLCDLRPSSCTFYPMMALGSWLPTRRHTSSRAVFGLKLQLAMSSTLDIDLGSRSTGLFATLEIQCFPMSSVQCFLSGDCDRALPMLSGDPSRDMLFCCAWALVPDFTCFTLHRHSSASRPRRTRLRRPGFLSVTLATFRRHHTSLLLSLALSVPVSSCVEPPLLSSSRLCWCRGPSSS